MVWGGEMSQLQKFGLVLFMIGLTGCAVNKNDIIFWFALIVAIIGVFLFLGKE